MYKYCIPLKYHTGTRAIRSHGPLEGVYINGAEQGLDYHDADNYTLYVSPYMTVNAERFTKYYYAGTQRIASKLGSGKFDNVYGVNGFHLTDGGKDYEERSVQMVKGVQDYYRQAGVTPGVPNQQGQHANPYISGVAYPSVPLGDYSVPAGWPGPVARWQQGQVFGPPVSFLREAPQEAKAGVGFKSDHQREGNLFYFHTDHLGSTSYLSDTVGNVSQFVWYAPYGEALVDEHTTTYENPFKFSGKELDDITGLYDHGDRSRNPISTLWYGVDILWEKHPEYSPFIYCEGNPVKLIDPDGKEVVADKQSQSNIKYKLSKKEAKYVKFDKNGCLNDKLLQKCNSTSRNINALKALSKSVSRRYNFQVAEKDHTGRMYYDKNDEEHFYRGTTEFPNADNNPSPDENIYVIVGSVLSTLQQVKTTAHEAYGHAYIYETNGQNIEDACHSYTTELGESYYDEELEMEVPTFDLIPSNHKLEEQIDAVVNEAEQNYKSHHE